ncbi:hypothetical protein U1Q18_029598 [Sarracenia purpurea var. burkii]
MARIVDHRSWSSWHGRNCTVFKLSTSLKGSPLTTTPRMETRWFPSRAEDLSDRTAPENLSGRTAPEKSSSRLIRVKGCTRESTKIEKLPKLVGFPPDIGTVGDLPEALVAPQPHRVNPEEAVVLVVDVDVAPPRREEVASEFPGDLLPARKRLEPFVVALEIAEVIQVVAGLVA